MSDTNDVRIRDFQSSTSRNRSATQAAPNIPRISLDSPSPGPRRYSTLSPSATIRGNISSMERARRASDASSASGSLHRRPTRQDTVRHYHSPSQPNWEVAGGEPGIDTSKDPEAHFDHLMQECQITVVDFSDERMSKYELDNEGLVEFLKDPREDWVACRWINVNGLSWDVIKELGNKHNLHRLAIEDLMNTRGRTKADWYSDHAFILLTLQKLIRTRREDPDSSDESGEVTDGKSHKKVPAWRRWLSGDPKDAYGKPLPPSPTQKLEEQKHDMGFGGGHKLASLKYPPQSPYRTLQRYRGGANFERTIYMERNSMLTKRDLAVSVEQVSIFITADNTVICFFEHSADDIEGPILKRLETVDTILRRSADASMLVQAVMDAIIDLAMPVVSAYEDTMGELEVDVLTDPDIENSKSLYILSSELAILRNNMQPVANVIAALRDHRNDPLAGSGTNKVGRLVASSVSISPLTHTYLGDVEDHCLTIVQNLDIMRRTVGDMIDLLFNQMGATQNESMQTLTTVTIFFLPLTFLTGYFGMNFEKFDAIKHSDAYFWQITAPVMFATICVLLHPTLSRWFKRKGQQWWIFRQKRARGVQQVRGGAPTRRPVSGQGRTRRSRPDFKDDV
ncbi:hypothetical protein BLS_003213 [Venturia inaequalis]|uniref:Uncharacterized protein n=1 Tax=Venturia inaequalis TaxID=5025 RepID=A0A8H3YUG2_VENIN|nr:hypothetical protein BLS_003213 [Venturia inaequalis]KAE9993106.1 hypothetical protein EG327_006459 [Venturia inaequalis]RDI88093.1 hypothetical protein Vi05172_g2002 [Venturia inaequalis]